MPRGYIRSRGERRWQLSVELPPDPATGQRRRVYETVTGKRKQAEARLTELLRRHDTGQEVEEANLLLRDYLPMWLDKHAKSNLRQPTLIQYRQLIRAHILPALGGLSLRSIRPIHLQQFYSACLAGGRKDGKGGLSPSTVKYLHAILSKALGTAVRWQMLHRNPVDAVEPPRATRQEMQYWTAAQVEAFLTAARKTLHYELYLTAIMTGLRRGELLGLRWRDLDLDTGKAAIRQAFVRAVDGSSAMTGPKTASGRRVVSLPESVVKTLRALRRRQREAQLVLGPEWEDHDLVFCSPNGSPQSPDVISRHFRRLVERVPDLPVIRFHDLRHTHATLMLSQGVHPKIVSERLGHSRITTTLDTYSHALPDLQEEAAAKLDALFEAHRGQNVGREA